MLPKNTIRYFYREISFSFFLFRYTRGRERIKEKRKRRETKENQDKGRRKSVKKNSHKRRPTRCSNRNVTRFNIFLTETKTIAVILMRSRRETRGTIWHVAKRRSWTYSEVFLFRVSRGYQLNDKRFNFTYYWQCNDNDNNDKGIHSDYICGDEERSNEVVAK